MNPEEDFQTWCYLLSNPVESNDFFKQILPDCNNLIYEIIDQNILSEPLAEYTDLFVCNTIPTSVRNLLSISPSSTFSNNYNDNLSSFLEEDDNLFLEYLSNVLLLCIWGVTNDKEPLFQLITDIFNENQVFYDNFENENDINSITYFTSKRVRKTSEEFNNLTDTFLASGYLNVILERLSKEKPFLSHFALFFDLIDTFHVKILENFDVQNNNFVFAEGVICLKNYFLDFINGDEKKLRNLDPQISNVFSKMLNNLTYFSHVDSDLNIPSLFDFCNICLRSSIFEKQIIGVSFFSEILNTTNQKCINAFVSYAKQNNMIQFLCEKNFHIEILERSTAIFQSFADKGELKFPEIPLILWSKALKSHFSDRQKLFSLIVNIITAYPPHVCEEMFKIITGDANKYCNPDEMILQKKKIISNENLEFIDMLNEKLFGYNCEKLINFYFDNLNEEIIRVHLNNLVKSNLQKSSRLYISKRFFELLESDPNSIYLKGLLNSIVEICGEDALDILFRLLQNNRELIFSVMITVISKTKHTLNRAEFSNCIAKVDNYLFEFLNVLIIELGIKAFDSGTFLDVGRMIKECLKEEKEMLESLENKKLKLILKRINKENQKNQNENQNHLQNQMQYQNCESEGANEDPENQRFIEKYNKIINIDDIHSFLFFDEDNNNDHYFSISSSFSFSNFLCNFVLLTNYKNGALTARSANSRITNQIPLNDFIFKKVDIEGIQLIFDFLLISNNIGIQNKMENTFIDLFARIYYVPFQRISDAFFGFVLPEIQNDRKFKTDEDIENPNSNFISLCLKKIQTLEIKRKCMNVLWSFLQKTEQSFENLSDFKLERHMKRNETFQINVTGLGINRCFIIPTHYTTLQLEKRIKFFLIDEMKNTKLNFLFKNKYFKENDILSKKGIKKEDRIKVTNSYQPNEANFAIRTVSDLGSIYLHKLNFQSFLFQKFINFANGSDSEIFKLSNFASNSLYDVTTKTVRNLYKNINKISWKLLNFLPDDINIVKEINPTSVFIEKLSSCESNIELRYRIDIFNSFLAEILRKNKENKFDNIDPSERKLRDNFIEQNGIELIINIIKNSKVSRRLLDLLFALKTNIIANYIDELIEILLTALGDINTKSRIISASLNFITYLQQYSRKDLFSQAIMEKIYLLEKTLMTGNVIITDFICKEIVPYLIDGLPFFELVLNKILSFPKIEIDGQKCIYKDSFFRAFSSLVPYVRDRINTEMIGLSLCEMLKNVNEEDSFFINILNSFISLKTSNDDLLNELLPLAFSSENEQITESILKLALNTKNGIFNENDSAFSSFFTTKVKRWNYDPNFEKKNSNFAGLRNLGATCYQNSIIQQLFFVTDFTHLILTSTFENPTNEKESISNLKETIMIETNETNYSEEKENNFTEERGTKMIEEKGFNLIEENSTPNHPQTNKSNHIAYEILKLFSDLLLTKKRSVDTKPFTLVWKGWNKSVVNVHEQQDALEFVQLFLDQLPPKINGLFRGQFINYIKGVSEEFMSNNVEDFFALTLVVKNLTCLNDSFKLFLQNDFFTDDNKIYAEELKKRIDAEKYTRIKKAPPILIIHLKRFEYDFNSLMRSKIKSQYEFSEKIDISQLMDKSNHSNSDEMNSSINENVFKDTYGDPNDTTYLLCGIVLHSGNAQSGHYMSLVKVGEKWFMFNDSEVSEYDPGRIPETFGGESNAYLLFYRRITFQFEDFEMLKDFVPKNIQNEIKVENGEFLKIQKLFSEPIYRFISSVNSPILKTLYLMNIVPRSYYFSGTCKDIFSEIEKGIKLYQKTNWFFNFIKNNFSNIYIKIVKHSHTIENSFIHNLNSLISNIIVDELPPTMTFSFFQKFFEDNFKLPLSNYRIVLTYFWLPASFCISTANSNEAKMICGQNKWCTKTISFINDFYNKYNKMNIPIQNVDLTNCFYIIKTCYEYEKDVPIKQLLLFSNQIMLNDSHKAEFGKLLNCIYNSDQDIINPKQVFHCLIKEKKAINEFLSEILIKNDYNLCAFKDFLDIDNLTFSNNNKESHAEEVNTILEFFTCSIKYNDSKMRNAIFVYFSQILVKLLFVYETSIYMENLIISLFPDAPFPEQYHINNLKNQHNENNESTTEMMIILDQIENYVLSLHPESDNNGFNNDFKNNNNAEKQFPNNCNNKIDVHSSLILIYWILKNCHLFTDENYFRRFHEIYHHLSINFHFTNSDTVKFFKILMKFPFEVFSKEFLCEIVQKCCSSRDYCIDNCFKILLNFSFKLNDEQILDTFDQNHYFFVKIQLMVNDVFNINLSNDYAKLKRILSVLTKNNAKYSDLIYQVFEYNRNNYNPNNANNTSNIIEFDSDFIEKENSFCFMENEPTELFALFTELCCERFDTKMINDITSYVIGKIIEPREYCMADSLKKTIVVVTKILKDRNDETTEIVSIDNEQLEKALSTILEEEKEASFIISKFLLILCKKNENLRQILLPILKKKVLCCIDMQSPVNPLLLYNQLIFTSEELFDFIENIVYKISTFKEISYKSFFIDLAEKISIFELFEEGFGVLMHGMTQNAPFEYLRPMAEVVLDNDNIDSFIYYVVEKIKNNISSEINLKYTQPFEAGAFLINIDSFSYRFREKIDELTEKEKDNFKKCFVEQYKIIFGSENEKDNNDEFSSDSKHYNSSVTSENELEEEEEEIRENLF